MSGVFGGTLHSSGQILDRSFSSILYGETIDTSQLWFGSGLYFTAVFQFPELSGDEYKVFDRDLARAANFDDKRILCDRYTSLTEVSTQPMSLAYNRNMMPWRELFRIFNEWFDENGIFVLKVDRRSLPDDAEKKIQTFLTETWEDFLLYCKVKGLEVWRNELTTIGCNLEFRLFQNVMGREQLLTVLWFVETLCLMCKSEECLEWSALIERLEGGIV